MTRLNIFGLVHAYILWSLIVRQASGQTPTSCTTITARDVAGPNLHETVVNSAADCRNLCFNRRDCKCYAFDPSRPEWGFVNRCWLKGFNANCALHTHYTSSDMTVGICTHPRAPPFVTFVNKPNGNNYATCDGLYVREPLKNLNGLPIYINVRRYRFLGWHGSRWVLTGLQYLDGIVNTQLKWFGGFHFSSTSETRLFGSSWTSYNVGPSVTDGTMFTCGSATYFMLHGTKRFVPTAAINNMFTNTNHRLDFPSFACDHIYDGPPLTNGDEMMQCDGTSLTGMKFWKTSQNGVTYKRLICDSSTMSWYHFKVPSTTSTTATCNNLCNQDTVCLDRVTNAVYNARNEVGDSCEPVEMQNALTLQLDVITDGTARRRRRQRRMAVLATTNANLPGFIRVTAYEIVNPWWNYNGVDLRNHKPDSTEDFVGIILYGLRDHVPVSPIGGAFRCLNSQAWCYPGQMWIIKSSALSSITLTHNLGQGKIHGKAYKYIFGVEPYVDGPIGSAFARVNGVMKYNSWSFNSIDRLWLDDGYHGPEKPMGSLERGHVESLVTYWLSLTFPTLSDRLRFIDSSYGIAYYYKAAPMSLSDQGVYMIKNFINVNSPIVNCLAGKTDDNVRLETCDSSSDLQKWRFERVFDGTDVYRLKNVGRSKFITGPTDTSKNVILGTSSVRFRFVRVSHQHVYAIRTYEDASERAKWLNVYQNIAEVRNDRFNGDIHQFWKVEA